MKKPIIILFLLCSSILADQIINLSGTWEFRMDPENIGERHNWPTAPFGEQVQLPGTMAQNGKGYEITPETRWTGTIVDSSYFKSPEYARYRQPGNIKIPFWLQPDRHYIGAAWYRKQITIPDNWQDKNIVLTLERPHWETTVWLDGRKIGSQNSLSTPHRYVLGQVKPGRHSLTIRVDNTVKIGVGINAHSVSDHTQSNWNGIAGKMDLEAKPRVWIDNIQVFPDIAAKTTLFKITVRNDGNSVANSRIVIFVKSQTNDLLGGDVAKFAEIAPGEHLLNIVCPLGDSLLLWDEFNPHLYSGFIKLETAGDRDMAEVQFGLRDFKADGTRFSVNGRKTFLRGTLECAIFPKTSFPAMSRVDWLRIFDIAKSFGLNHMRFHSWCPPEAAFAAADEAGFYLHVECASWANQGSSIGDGKPVDRFIFDESERIVREYGNHPSFVMMAYGNEPAGKNQEKFLSRFVSHWKEKDPRRLYTGAAGWPPLEVDDYHVHPQARIQAWGGGLKSILNARPPQTMFDYAEIISKYDRPYVSHEIGQWCVYPNFKEIPKYTGVLKPKNFEIFRETLEAHHMGHLAEKFVLASGKLQALCYKADIEAALRTPGMAGFELLDLHDFPGQGTALVGVLDPFWEEKGYITAEEYSRFCNTTVPLARLEKRVFTGGETITAQIEVAHFGQKDMDNVSIKWELKGDSVFGSGSFAEMTLATGQVTNIGNIAVPLQRNLAAQKLTLEVTAGEYSNSWDLWVYPASLPENSGNVMITTQLNEEAVEHLKNGGKVLLSLGKGKILPEKGGDIPVGFTSIFWNTAWTRKQPPHTLGILCDPSHPALAEFPTEYHSNWQWWEPIKHCSAMVLDDFEPGMDPIVRLIDDWFTNRSLGLIFEAKVGKGRLMVSSVDVVNELESRPVIRQLRHSLLKYMNSESFVPKKVVPIEKIAALVAG